MAFADELRDGTWKVNVPDFPFEDVVIGLMTVIEEACKANASKGKSGLLIEGRELYVELATHTSFLPWFEELCQKVGKSDAERIRFIFRTERDVCRYHEHEKILKEALSGIIRKNGFKKYEQYEYVSMQNGRVSLVAFYW